jgi:hypothetical protein
VFAHLPLSKEGNHLADMESLFEEVFVHGMTKLALQGNERPLATYLDAKEAREAELEQDKNAVVLHYDSLLSSDGDLDETVRGQLLETLKASKASNGQNEVVLLVTGDARTVRAARALAKDYGVQVLTSADIARLKGHFNGGTLLGQMMQEFFNVPREHVRQAVHLGKQSKPGEFVRANPTLKLLLSKVENGNMVLSESDMNTMLVNIDTVTNLASQTHKVFEYLARQA